MKTDNTFQLWTSSSMQSLISYLTTDCAWYLRTDRIGLLETETLSGLLSSKNSTETFMQLIGRSGNLEPFFASEFVMMSKEEED